MRKLFLAVVAICLALCLEVRATTVGGMSLTCPACAEKFSSTFIGSSSSFGEDDEGRPISLGEDTQKYRLHACPKCHYSGFGGDFKGEDVPKGQQLADIRAVLAREGKAFPTGALWPLERAVVAEICMRAAKAEPWKIENLCMLGAWLADDAGEDALAAQWRDKALLARIEWAEISDPVQKAACAKILSRQTPVEPKDAILLCEVAVPLVELLLKKADEESKVTDDGKEVPMKFFGLEKLLNQLSRAHLIAVYKTKGAEQALLLAEKSPRIEDRVVLIRLCG
ncbi:MAG: DUF2225 domain-containing protein, partial [Phycisphaerales bacterium]|nr:DUF2225 domain-containing protein [Phycisphaerales bacterium]